MPTIEAQRGSFLCVAGTEEEKTFFLYSREAVFSVQYELRPKEQLSIHHIMQHSTSSYHHTDG
jgi:hypothetical protein